MKQIDLFFKVAMPSFEYYFYKTNFLTYNTTTMGAIIPRKVVSFDTWQKGIAIHAGYSVFVHYKGGEWNINPSKHGIKKYGPEGSPVDAAKETYPLPGRKEGCLLGRLIFPKNKVNQSELRVRLDNLNQLNGANADVIFSIEREGILIPKTDYPKVLQLRCNDIDTGIFDNEGALEMELEIW